MLYDMYYLPLATCFNKRYICPNFTNIRNIYLMLIHFSKSKQLVLVTNISYDTCILHCIILILAIHRPPLCFCAVSPTLTAPLPMVFSQQRVRAPLVIINTKNKVNIVSLFVCYDIFYFHHPFVLFFTKLLKLIKTCREPIK